MSKITVIPGNKNIIVDGVALTFEFSAPAGIHAIQWDNTTGHVEYDDPTTKPNHIFGQDEYNIYVKPYLAAWTNERDRLQAEEEQKEQEFNRWYDSTEQRFVRLRTERDKRLAETDYLLASDYPIGAEKLEAVRQYRQALRDLPAKAGAPWTDETIPWPVKPQM